uniref:Uncharacterized protein n=1 Tax=Rhizophora mucronata TaxID=61149 RepID=A0A2P2NWI5_RHIMU
MANLCHRRKRLQVVNHYGIRVPASRLEAGE